MSSQQGQVPPPGPPYPPQGAQLGGTPTVSVDVPISSVLIAIFISAAAFNMTVFQKNRRRGHKFVPSVVVFGFCMARITANVLRIAWATRHGNVRLAIAASIFFNAGVLILFILNLLFLQRIVRAYHPTFGWSRSLSWAFKFLYFGIFACLVMVIASAVYAFYTPDRSILSKLLDVRRVAVVYMAVLAFIPLPGALLCILIPRKNPLEKFGQGSMRTKIILVVFTSALLSLGAGFRAGVAFTQRMSANPGWFNSKAAYYCFNYLVEIIVVFSYTIARFDRRFHVPNGSSAPGHYSRRISEKSVHAAHPTTDEEALRGDERPPTEEEERQRERVWEDKLRGEVEGRLAQ